MEEVEDQSHQELSSTMKMSLCLICTQQMNINLRGGGGGGGGGPDPPGAGFMNKEIST